MMAKRPTRIINIKINTKTIEKKTNLIEFLRKRKLKQILPKFYLYLKYIHHLHLRAPLL